MAHIVPIEGGCVDVRALPVGFLQTNCYFVSDGASLFVVDPGSSAEAIANALDGRTPDAIVITHRHFDHVGALKKLHELTGAPVVASAIDAPYICGEAQLETEKQRFDSCPIARRMNDGDVLEIGAMRWQIMITPGHTAGSMCLLIDPSCGNHAGGRPVLLSGDTLFYGCTGRTDFEGGSEDDMVASVHRLAQLPDETLVLPGHNAPTTIANEWKGTFLRYNCKR